MQQRLTLRLTLILLFLAACSPPATGSPDGAPPAANAPVAGPRLAADATLLDLGEIVNGVVVERDVAVRNDGNALLVVEEVLTTCGCTTAALEPMTLAPGEAGNLHIAFDSGAHGPELTGPVMRRVILVSNDPATPEATVDLQALILPR